MFIDRLYTNANVITLDPMRPRASCLAILGDRIIAVGEAHDMESLTAADVVDLEQATVVPGFNDAHNHTLRLGLMLNEIQLESPATTSVDDILRAVRARATEVPRGGWIVGCSYDQNKLAEGRHPTADELQAAAPHHHVWLKHTSLHMATVSRSVLELIDIDNATIPDGGWVERDSAGRATGMLLENAQELVSRLAFPQPLSTIAEAIGRAHDRYVSEGITSCQEAGIGAGLATANPQDLAAFAMARRESRLLARTTMMVGIDALHDLTGHKDDEVDLGLDLGIASGLGDAMLRIGATKVWADGSLVGRTAAMEHGFADDHENCGRFLYDPDELFELIRRAHRSGWQIAAHAIGDRAVGAVLGIYEKVLAEVPRVDHRHRIEHCAVTSQEDLRRIGALGVIPVPQGRFINELGDGMMAALGPERVKDCYRQRSFIASGIRVPGSSDRPVVEGAPLLGIADLVLRRTSSGQSFGSAERLTVEQALRAWTTDSAYASFEEHIKGVIKPGMLADIAVLSEDITAIDPASIPEVRVLRTVRGGATVFEAG